MKSISYLDMVHEILNDNDFQEFQKTYELPVKKSIKLISHRGLNSGNFEDIIKTTISYERELLESDFSYQGKKYTDVLFATRKEGLKPDSLGNHFLHQAGLIYVQEMAASLSVQMLGIEPGDKALDMCAAPGGKSIQISDMLVSSGMLVKDLTKKGKDSSAEPQNDSDDGFLISNEPDSGRKKALESNIYRCGKYNVGIIQQDGCEVGNLFPEFFDKVLVDAPCSGEGMQYKSGKKVWQRDEKKSQKLSQLQTQLLISGLESLKVGGELVYSTCTTNPLENECVISAVLEKYEDKIELLSVPLDEKSEGISIWRDRQILTAENCKKVARLWPHEQGTGGFFIAKFRKIKSFLDRQYNIDNITAENYEQLIRKKLSQWGITQDSKIGFFIDKFTVNVAPKTLIDSQIQYKIPNIKIGLPIFKIVKDSKKQEEKLIPLVGISQFFGAMATENVLDISDFQLKAIMERGDLHDARLADYEGKFILLRRNGIGIGLVSVQKGIGKNKCF